MSASGQQQTLLWGPFAAAIMARWCLGPPPGGSRSALEIDRRCDLCERNNPPGRNRTECLKLDWNEKVLAAKIRNLAKVIGRFEGRGPDILVLQEVENRAILDRLRSALPDAASYRTVINRDDSLA
jgi:hypothetical protein